MKLLRICPFSLSELSHLWATCLSKTLTRMVMLSGLVAIAAPIPPAIAARKDSELDYRNCAASLINLKISPELAVSACSRAQYPQNLSTCVIDISRVTPKVTAYEPTDALDACRQVRRPEDMAFCVTGIRRYLTDSVAGEVLDSCRRSLQPVQYANCVVGISRGTTGLSSPVALSSCIGTQAFPREVDPTFIPYVESPLQIPQDFSPQPSTAPPFAQPVPSPQTPEPAPVRGLF
ncbi:hypothetical protein JOY44_10845 [Phormidium sp. CLA17]|uniref:hypothetical protein n=1 Tax=Leptolyngbya sp. Cla-17 TaxID=2803751 RepID=UPI001492F10B|nr:hypothetical protein [Leptolyngbya sp. Cla-17]MBM0742113.1 hypothetical protein [Leptolyngbya sp. Cla-17]